MFKSIGDITKKIISIENENMLFEWHINDIFIWEIIRYKIYHLTLNKSFDKNTLEKKRSFNSISSKATFKILKFFNAIIYNPFFDKVKSEVLVFESSRKLLYKGNYIDPYTKFLFDELLKDKVSVTKYQSSFRFDKLATREFGIKHLDIIYYLSLVINRFKKLHISEIDNFKIFKLQQIFANELDLKIDLLKLIKKEMLDFKEAGKYFNIILKNKSPQRIYIVNFCDKPALIAKAKERGITVIDIQHGLISSDDIIYHYPNNKKGSLHYFPDKFYIWSKLWRKVCSIPLNESDIVEYGNKYLSNKKKQYDSIKKNEKQIIIISQPGLTQAIAAEFLKKIEKLTKYEVIYKLHPSEYLNAFNITELVTIRSKNVIFLDKDRDLYQAFAESSYVIGVGSTALIEALNFDCKILLFNLPGVEWMKPFVDNKDVKFLDKFLE